MGIASFSPIFSLAKFGLPRALVSPAQARASASSSASSSAPKSASALFAPAQALAAFFIPRQINRRHADAATQFLAPSAPQALGTQSANKPDSHWAGAKAGLTAGAGALPAAFVAQPIHRLKVVREFEPGMRRSQAGRMAISGRMADVCAELDRIASKESAREITI